MLIDTIIHHAAQLLTCASDYPKRGAAMRDVGIITDGAVAVDGGRIVAVGSSTYIGQLYQARTTIDASGKIVCPGFVDAHTQIVYVGDRAAEFELRIAGASYLEIMAAGGGIVSTMRKVRAASLDELVTEARTRLNTMLALGTTTVEIKTGYGLDLESELKMLRAIARLAESHPITIIPTFMGAHTIPPEYHGRADAFTQYVIDTLIPAVAEWYRTSCFPTRLIPLFVDVACEPNAFTCEQSRRILVAGVAHGMRVKAHVDEAVSLGGTPMALALGATSIDHLDVTTAEDIAQLAQSATVGVILPVVNFNAGSSHFANARSIIDAGAALALATDYNPGAAPCPAMPLVMALACRYQRLLPAEAINASTINAAYAVDLGEHLGSIQVGKMADLLVVHAPDYRYLAYQVGSNLVERVLKQGKIVV